MSMLVLLFNVLALGVTVLSANITVYRPLDGQLPPIARISKPYSWTFANETFVPRAGSLKYSTSSLPRWLSFDADRTTFSGTPSEGDEGDTRITVTAKDSSSTASSTFNLCVTTDPEPEVHIPIQRQFVLPQPSMSSVFALANNSALATRDPALRIIPKWSFSIGFDYETCKSSGRTFYDVRCQDGSDLPGWMSWNHKALTINGVAPNANTLPQPATFRLLLLCSDQESYFSLSLPFGIIASAHELSTSTSSLPTINITASTPFSVNLYSPADYSGILVDGKAIQPHEILDLKIDISQYSAWLEYDRLTRTLSGDPGNASLVPGTNPPMPVTLTTIFNQTIQTLVSLHVVPSYFSSAELPAIDATRGSQIQFSLAQYLSNAASQEEIRLTASFEPPETAQYLAFDQRTAQLSGIIPPSFSGPHVSITFTAYSTITHSTSHTRLSIVLPPLGHAKSDTGSKSAGRSAISHTRLVLGLSLTFGILGGLCLLAGLLAIFRRVARVPDTAIEGEEGRNFWSDQDKKWYNQGLQTTRWTESPNFTERPKPTSEKRAHGHGGDYPPALGLGLRRVSERSQSEIATPSSRLQSPGVMSKREFMARLKRTVRVVSDKARGRQTSRQKPLISHPIPSHQSMVPSSHEDPAISGYPSNPPGAGMESYPGSTIMSDSPSASTAEHSIPRRRLDFAPPKLPNHIHLKGNPLSRQSSAGSTDSSASNASTKAHTAEGVVRTVSKVIGLRGGINSSGFSIVSNGEPMPAPSTIPRPRLVPFTSETRVPVPRPFHPNTGSDSNVPRRMNSQKAMVWEQSTRVDDTQIVTKSGSGDELRMGIHYVQSLGTNSDDVQDTRTRAPPKGLASPDQKTQKDRPLIMRSGEKSNFRVPLPPISTLAKMPEIRLVSGKPLPEFLHADMGLRGSIELHGTPGASDVGTLVVGVYNADGSCIKVLTLEVVKWR